ncbi:unnamed protein product [Rotaria sp. Silwood2]|nr:unnamed protein product [Rotaria sp. Silwood2]CAF4413606.1 unnamed protein product [Rotaria sp. Silwood2]
MTEHNVKKRCVHGCRPSRHRHHPPWQNPNSPSWPNTYPSPWSNPYPSPWSNPYRSPWQNPNPIGIPFLQPRYRRSLSVFDDYRRSENLANGHKLWQGEQKFADRARGFSKSHLPLHEINNYDPQDHFGLAMSLIDKNDHQMSVGIDETLDKSFQTATHNESTNQL